MKYLLWIPMGCLVALGIVWAKPDIVQSLREQRDVLVATKGGGKRFLAGKITDGVVVSQDIILNPFELSRIQGLDNPQLHMRFQLANLHEDNREGLLQAALWLAGKRYEGQSRIRGEKAQTYRFNLYHRADIADTGQITPRIEIRGVGIPRDKSLACLLTRDLTTGRAALNAVPMKGALRFSLARMLPEPWYRYWAGVALLAIICMTCTLLAQVWLTTQRDKHAAGEAVF